MGKKEIKKIKLPLTSGVAKVPVVMQMEALECGAASLAMVCAYYEKWIPLEQIRLDCGVSRDGANAKNLLVAARSYGFTAKGYRYEPEDLRRLGKFPCIIHWNFNHFVVLDGFRGNKAYLNDPAKGSYSVSMETFDNSFTGICLIFEPNETFAPSGKQKSVFSFAMSRLKGARTAVVFVVLTTLISALIGVISPAFSRIFMDRLLTHESPDWFYPFMIALFVMSALQLLISALEAYYSNRINAKLATVGSTSFLWKVLHLPMEFFSQRLAGDIQGSNAGIANSVVNAFAPLALNAIMMVFYLVVMIRYSWILTLVGLASLVVNAFMARIISKKRINITRVSMRDAGKLAGATIAGVEMIETIKASGAENGFFERWAGYQASVNSAKVKYAKINQYLGMIPAAVSTVTGIVVLTLGIWSAMEGTFTVGMIMAFQGMLSSFSAPATTFIPAGQTMQEMRTQMERIDDVMLYREDECYQSEGKQCDLEKLKGNIELKNITFGYSRLSAPIIKDFSLTVKPGERIALVGSSGCGKSTISKLVSGLYQPWNGEILYDGKPLSEVNRDVFTGSIAVVDQEVTLFEDSISNNIKMWDTSIEDFEMILAARDAQIHEEIMRRDGGYNYKIAEGGKDFSGGQRQRLEIARVLAKDPTVVILDEATSALDTATERRIQAAFDRLAKGRTTLVIAHRLSTIKNADEIIVIGEQGILERGTHAELVKQGGVYAALAEGASLSD